MSKALGTSTFDDTATGAGLTTGLNALQTTGSYNSPADPSDLRGSYNTIFSKFQTFAELERKDHIFIADPLRPIFVTGTNSKTLKDPSKNWSQHIFSALRHQFSLANTSYATTYANWAKINDKFSGRDVWVPFSGIAASIMTTTDTNNDPWWAPAGFTRGRVFGVNDIAIEPNQKQRDDLYKFSLNPITAFREGITVFGQKTLQKMPGAFDRINVRRLFLYLEKVTKATVRYYVFEPNSLFTRTRVKDDLRPLFERAKNNEGVYDYIVVCDERNNTPDVIDQNELIIDIYIKPIRAAEFILVNFYATRTGADFQEFIG
jgi:phage tail sheath protein FI